MKAKAITRRRRTTTTTQQRKLNSTMKKLGKKGKIHPSPSPVLSITGHLTSLLPATILTLAAALSPEDKEVLAYLVSCSGSAATTADNFSGYNKTTHNRKSSNDGHDHAPVFECNCFRCYMSFWARWDTSPNRQLIHEIIEAYEEGLYKEKRSLKKKKRNYSRKTTVSDELKHQSCKDESVSPETMSCGGDGDAEDVVEVGGGDHEDGHEVEFEKSSMRKIVSFLGEKILDFWHRN